MEILHCYEVGFSVKPSVRRLVTLRTQPCHVMLLHQSKGSTGPVWCLSLQLPVYLRALLFHTPFVQSLSEAPLHVRLFPHDLSRYLGIKHT